MRNGADRPAISTGPALMIPAGYPRDLPSALLRAARDFGTAGVVEIGPDGRETRLDFPILLELAARILAGLRANGVRAGDPAVVHCTEPVGFFAAFWACTLGGIRPLLIGPSPAGDRSEEGRERLRKVTDLLGWTVLIGRPTDLPDDLGLPVLDPDALAGHEPTSDFHRPAADDVAVLMMSSGSSTGTPKIIQLTHRGLVEFAAGTPAMLPVRPGQITLNWLPLDQSGAFLLYHLLPVFTGCTNIHVSTDWVQADPLRWLDLMDQYRVNHSWAPNFGYRLVTAAIAGEPERHWDLSALRSLVSGGEQITVPVMSEFLRLTNRFGVVPETFVAAWGMTETVTGITFARPGLTPNVHRVRIPSTGVVEWVDQRANSGKVAVARPGKPRAEAPGVLSLVSVGAPAPGTTVRIVGPNGAVLPEGRIGQLQVASARVTPGYLGNPDADRAAFPAGNWPARKWLATGDQAFITGGQVVITGRDSERIVLNGETHYAHAVEAVAAAVPGAPEGLIAACGIPDPSTGTDRLTVFYAQLPELRPGLAESIRLAVQDRLGLAAQVVGVPRQQFPTTPGGKILRPLLKQRWLESTFDPGDQPTKLLRPAPAGSPASQPAPGRPLPPQAITGQPLPPQPATGQPSPPQPYGGQSYLGQPAPGQPVVNAPSLPPIPSAPTGDISSDPSEAPANPLEAAAGALDTTPAAPADDHSDAFDEDPNERTTELPVVRLAWRREIKDSIPKPPERPTLGAGRPPADAPVTPVQPPAAPSPDDLTTQPAPNAAVETTEDGRTPPDGLDVLEPADHVAADPEPTSTRASDEERPVDEPAAKESSGRTAEQTTLQATDAGAPGDLFAADAPANRPSSSEEAASDLDTSTADATLRPATAHAEATSTEASAVTDSEASTAAHADPMPDEAVAPAATLDTNTAPVSDQPHADSDNEPHADATAEVTAAPAAEATNTGTTLDTEKPAAAQSTTSPPTTDPEPTADADSDTGTTTEPAPAPDAAASLDATATSTPVDDTTDASLADLRPEAATAHRTAGPQSADAAAAEKATAQTTDDAANSTADVDAPTDPAADRAATVDPGKDASAPAVIAEPAQTDQPGEDPATAGIDPQITAGIDPHATAVPVGDPDTTANTGTSDATADIGKVEAADSNVSAGTKQTADQPSGEIPTAELDPRASTPAVPGTDSADLDAASSTVEPKATDSAAGIDDEQPVPAVAGLCHRRGQLACCDDRGTRRGRC
ncbi:AMP-binding protein [Kribbella flavida]|nr:AMP-binding protein [Kribbella flavida]